MRIGIVGGGVSGLAAARAASREGAEVVVFDKGRGFGGRLSTRRVELPDGRTLFFDHGTPWFDDAEARDEGDTRWRAFVDIALEAGAAHRIQPARLAGAPHMNAFLAHLGEPLDVRFRVRVDAIEPGADGLVLRSEGVALGSFDRVIVTAPAPQAATLLAPIDPDAASTLGEIRYQPQWVAMLALPREGAGEREIAGDGLVLERLTSRDGLAWVARATQAWSRANLESSTEDARAALAAAAGEADQQFRAAEPVAAHRWRYAHVTRSLAAPSVSAHGGRLIVCGDGFGGRGVRAAWMSGDRAGAEAAP